jgi:protein involved in plasmid replication-relaxation
MAEGSSMRERQERAPARNEEPLRSYPLQDRDRQLLTVLAMCRCLSTEQIRRLCFAGRTETPAHKRLRQLAGIGKYGFPEPLVERTVHQTYAGDLVTVWTPTTLGYVVAGNVVETITRPPRGADICPALIEHALLLNELFVGLSEAPLKKALGIRTSEIPRRRHRSAADGLYVNAQALRFKWIASDSVRLPWKEYRDGDSIERIIHPDAVLELPSLRRRLFLEAETGSHSIVPRGYLKPGSTLNKAERYELFLCEFADVDVKITFYAQRYSDGFTPEVLFLVPNAGRAESVNGALTEWSAQRPSRWKLPGALTISDAVREILTALGQWSSELEPALDIKARAGALLTARDIKVLSDFFNDTVGTLKRVREAARGRNEMPPAYPAATEEARKLLVQLWRIVRPRDSA